MSNVYFFPVSGPAAETRISSMARQVFETLIDQESVALAPAVPLKVHFGEQGNTTFIREGNFSGIIDALEERSVSCSYIETNVLYGGERNTQEKHRVTAARHGFTRLPIIIADGDVGENYYEAKGPGHNFKTCLLGREFEAFDQFVVLSHFKGHMLAGFGGAIKQLAMGFASRGGKLAQHAGEKPFLKKRKCKKCHLCLKSCAVDAITIDENPRIDHGKCMGCAACSGVCPHGAITLFTFKSILRMLGFGNPFADKIVEYAGAAHLGRRNIYINYALNITRGCDCEGRKMKPCIADIGVLASLDPVAIDQACLDLAREKGKKFRKANQLKYAEELGIGTRDYNLIQL